MHDVQKGKHVFQCDGPGCSEVIETNEDDFKEALKTMRTEGWLARRRDEKWEHFCSNRCM